MQQRKDSNPVSTAVAQSRKLNCLADPIEYLLNVVHVSDKDIGTNTRLPHTSNWTGHLHTGTYARSKLLSIDHVFQQVDDLLASQIVALDIAFTILPHDVVVGSLWLRAAQIAKDLSDTLFESQSGQLRNNNIPRLPRQVPANCVIRSGKISENSVVRGNDFRFLVPLRVSPSLVYAFERRTES